MGVFFKIIIIWIIGYRRYEWWWRTWVSKYSFIFLLIFSFSSILKLLPLDFSFTESSKGKYKPVSLNQPPGISTKPKKKKETLNFVNFWII